MGSKLVNVVSLGSRDYYKVAIALYKNGQLGELITDFYCPSILRKVIKKRYTVELPANYTRSIWWIVFLVKLLSHLVSKNSAQRNLYVDFTFG